MKPQYFDKQIHATFVLENFCVYMEWAPKHAFEKRGEGSLRTSQMCCYTVYCWIDNGIVFYIHISQKLQCFHSYNILLFFSNETFSLPSKQEMLIFCSTATASLYRRGHQPMAPTTTQSGPSACRKIAGMLKAISCCIKVLIFVLSFAIFAIYQFLFSQNSPQSR